MSPAVDVTGLFFRQFKGELRKVENVQVDAWIDAINYVVACLGKIAGA